MTPILTLDVLLLLLVAATAVAVVSARVDAPRQEIVLGFGAHVDHASALRRAMLETSQMLALVHAARQGTLVLAPPMKRWLQDATLHSRRFLVPADAPGDRARIHYPGLGLAVEHRRVDDLGGIIVPGWLAQASSSSPSAPPDR